MRGVPLIVSEPPEDQKEKTRLEGILRELQFKVQQGKDKSEESVKNLKSQLDEVTAQISGLSKADQSASVDSEIALVRESDYPLSGWIPNPYFIGYRGKSVKGMPAGALWCPGSMVLPSR